MGGRRRNPGDARRWARGFNLLVQFSQGGQVTLEIGFILGAVAGVRLDEGGGDFPANLLGQHRVQPDMRIAGQVGSAAPPSG